MLWSEFVTMAEDLVSHYGLTEWAVVTKRGGVGLCSFSKKELQFYRPWIEINSDEQCRNTLLHEIAHAIVGPGHGHGPTWKAKAIEIGAQPRYDTDESAVMVPKKYHAFCPVCNHEFQHTRLPKGKRACANHGRTFDEKYLLVYKLNPNYKR